MFFFSEKKKKKNAHFRIQGGYPERYGRTDGERTEILVSNIGFKYAAIIVWV